MKRVGVNGICLLLLAMALLSAAARAPAEDAVPCEPRDGLRPVCGLHAPEDIVVAPNGRDLVFGQMAEPGGLFLLELPGHSVRALPVVAGKQGGEPLWGHADCESPPSRLLVHGIDLRQRADRRWQLLAVNHGEREAVEFFELVPGGAGPEVIWRGCAPAPADASLNDVASLPEGGFLATRMSSVESPLWEMFLAVAGIDNGVVYHWQREDGYAALPATEGRFPNGIVVAPDGNSFFVNMYLGNKVQKFSWPGAELLGEVAIAKPDNGSWSEDGKLLVASHYASLLQLFASLDHDSTDPSLLPFAIMEIDPQTLSKRQLIFQEGPPMGAGTVGVQRGDALYVGSYVGDRILRIALQPAR